MSIPLSIAAASSLGPRAIAFNDTVVLPPDSAKVTSIDQLQRQIDKAGDHVALLIERNGQKIFVPVRIG